MDLSLFLAKLIGLYLMILALIWLFRREEVETSTKEIVKAPAVIAVTGVFSLLIGLAIVIDHSVWEMSWKCIITVLGWLAIVQGILRIGFPKQARVLVSAILPYRYIMIVILFLLGSYLAYHGFML
jgi:uncharacterized protein YjeT (DUF2065 family)